MVSPRSTLYLKGKARVLSLLHGRGRGERRGRWKLLVTLWAASNGSPVVDVRFQEGSKEPTVLPADLSKSSSLVSASPAETVCTSATTSRTKILCRRTEKGDQRDTGGPRVELAD